MIFNSRTIKGLLWGCALLLLAGAPVAQAQSLQFVPVISAYSGTGTGGYVDGSAATSQFSSPHISDIDAAGNLYTPDTTNGLVRRVDPNGNVCTYGGYFATGTVTVCPGMAPAGPVCAAKTDTVGDGCPATQATLNMPKGLRVDPFGNIVIADVNNNRIRSINAQTGIITTIVGTGTANNGTTFTNGAKANAIKLFHPFDLTFDKAGNLYISDTSDNYIVLVLAVNGAIVPGTSTAYVIAGTGVEGHITSDGAVANTAQVDLPRGLAVDVNGNIFFSDYQNDAIRKITTPIQNGAVTPASLLNSFISTYAGNGNGDPGPAGPPCCPGDNGPALQASISNPQGITLDQAGNLYITQFTQGYEAIREVHANTGLMTTLVGTGANAHTGDGGPANLATVFSPAGLSIDRYGRALIDDSSNNRIRAVQLTTVFPTTAVGASSAASNVVAQASATVTPASFGVTAGSHEFTTGAMTGCTVNTGAAAGANCSIPVTFKPATPGPHATAVGITDTLGNHAYVGVVGIGTAPSIAFTPATITTLAGTGTAGNTGNAGPASLATVSAPRGSTIDASGSLVFADSGSNVIRRIDHTTGGILVLAGSGTSGYSGDGASALQAKLNAPKGVAFDATGNLYIADTGNNVIRRVDAQTGIISTIAGTSTPGYTGDLGLATAATLNAPTGLAMDFAGRLYVADTGNNVVRSFIADGGYITTVAGTGTAGYSGDTGQGALAKLNAPSAVAVDPTGILYIADTGNNVVRMVTVAGVISTYAGTNGVTSNAGDGGAATAAGLQSPSDVALDAAGDLYIAAGGQVRFVSVSGTISTMAGSGASGAYSGEGGLATLAVIPNPATNLAVDSLGNVYVSATTANRILTVSSATAPTVDFGLQALNTASAPKVISVVNVGNLPLALSGLVVSSPRYTLQTPTGACTSSTTLAAGASCTLSIVFTPALAGTTTGTITLTDNTLNGTAVTQTISLTGTSGTATTTTLTTVPTSLTYGQPITLHATVASTATLTGSVVFTVDGVTVGTVPLASGAASLTLPKLGAGLRTIVATYGSDPVAASSFSSVQVSVTQAVLTVTATSSTRAINTPNPAFGYAISGFLYSETASVVSGAAVFISTATTSSALGTYPITLGSSTLSAANYSFVYVGGTLTVTPPDYTLSATPSTITIPAGQTADVVITLTPNGAYAGTVTLSCGTLPANVTCNFVTNPLVADGSGAIITSRLVIATDNFQHLGGLTPMQQPGRAHWMPFSLAALPLLLLCGLRKKRLDVRVLMALALLMAMGGMTACANAGKATAATGTNTITLTGADTNSHSHTVSVSITLQ